MHTLIEQATQIDHAVEIATRINLMLGCKIKVYQTMGLLDLEVNKIFNVGKVLNLRTAIEEAIHGDNDQKN